MVGIYRVTMDDGSSYVIIIIILILDLHSKAGSYIIYTTKTLSQQPVYLLELQSKYPEQQRCKLVGAKENTKEIVCELDACLLICTAWMNQINNFERNPVVHFLFAMEINKYSFALGIAFWLFDLSWCLSYTYGKSKARWSSTKNQTTIWNLLTKKNGLCLVNDVHFFPFS